MYHLYSGYKIVYQMWVKLHLVQTTLNTYNLGIGHA